VLRRRGEGGPREGGGGGGGGGGGEGFVQYGHFSDKGGGFFRCGSSHFLVQKKTGIFVIYGDRTGQGGRGSILCGRPLWTVPNC